MGANGRGRESGREGEEQRCFFGHGLGPNIARSAADADRRTDGRRRQRQIELISQWFCCVIADADDDDDDDAPSPLPFRARSPSTALSSADRRSRCARRPPVCAAHRRPPPPPHPDGRTDGRRPSVAKAAGGFRPMLFARRSLSANR